MEPVPPTLIGQGRLLGPPGERLHVVDRAPRDGTPPVLLVHGFPGNLAAWTRVVDALPPDRGFVAVDLLGLGRSDRNARAAHSPGGHATRLAAVLDELGVDGVTAVGLSYGGAVVAWLAVTEPQRVGRLVLVASVDPTRPDALRRHWRLQALGMAAGLVAPPLARRVLARGMRSEAMDPTRVTPEVVDAYLAPLLVPGTARSFWAYGRDAALDPPLDPQRVRAPTTVVHGTDDGIVPVETGRRLAAAIPGATLRLIDGGRHLLTWDLPAAIVDAVGP